MTYKQIFENFKHLLPSDMTIEETSIEETSIDVTLISKKFVMRQTVRAYNGAEMCYKLLLEDFVKKGIEYYVHKNNPK